MIKVQCPNCKKTVIWSKESPFRPFCSERCRLIDLGAWADGSYSIPVTEKLSEDDIAEGFEESDIPKNKNLNLDEIDEDNEDKNGT